MFYLFVYSTYYPAGGLDDLKGQYPTREMAKAAAETFPGDSKQIARLDSQGRLMQCSWFDHGHWIDDDDEAGK